MVKPSGIENKNIEEHINISRRNNSSPVYKVLEIASEQTAVHKTQKTNLHTYLRPANILAIFPLLLVEKTSLSSHTIKSSAAIREENDEKGANSFMLANVSSPPYTSPEDTYK